MTEFNLSQLDDDPDSLVNWWEQIGKNLETLTELVRSGLEFSTHRTIVALISSEVHNMDIVKN